MLFIVLLKLMTICCFTFCSSNFFEPIDKKEFLAPWGIEHRIGIEMLHMNLVKDALYSFRCSSILLPYPRGSYYDIMNKYYQMVCCFLLKNYEGVIEIYESMQSKDYLSVRSSPCYKGFALMLCLSYGRMGNVKKKISAMNDIAMISPIVASKIHEIDEINNYTISDVKSSLLRTGEEDCIDVGKLVKRKMTVSFFEIVFPEYVLYSANNKGGFTMVCFLDAALLIGLSKSIKSDVRCGIFSFLMVRLFLSVKSLTNHYKETSALKKQAIEMILSNRKLGDKELIFGVR